ncbi:MAG: amylo-alpha-1,6-glucosidase [Bacteroidota bacterium]
MRTSALLLSALLIAGCARNESGVAVRAPLTLDALGIAVREGERSYMQSDKEGAFLTGTVGREADVDRWSVEGVDVFEGISIESAGGTLNAGRPDSALILPDETRRWYRGGTSVTISLLEGIDGIDAHGLVLRVASAPDGMLEARFRTAPGLSPVRPSPYAQGSVWRMADGRLVAVTAGPESVPSQSGILVDSRGAADFIAVVVPGNMSPESADSIYGLIDFLRAHRHARMERLLNASYVRTSDDTLNRALQWIKLSLDGLMIDRRDTLAVAGIPWDGSIDLRANAQSIAGLGLATGDYRRTAAIIRTLARYQDTDRRSPTYGRVADRVDGRRISYRGADVAPWFVRELYEHVVYSNDTALVRSLYPAVRQSIEGTIARHTDKFNFLTHGPDETWMTGVPRGNRAVELQLLWYFQQLIGSYVATFLGDTANARAWWDSSVKTSDNFALQFADTAAGMLADHLLPNGARDMASRPNAIMCLEMLETESMRYRVTRSTVLHLLHNDGVASLGGRRGVTPYDGPVWTWLAGPVTYALTRYDRQDLSYVVTSSMARRALEQDMAGTLPARLDPGSAGDRASLTGMAEFIRTVYQDYLGVRVDLAAGTLTLQPKLPDQLKDAEITVFGGTHPIRVSYARGADEGRIELDAPDLPGEMNVNFLWMMDSGDAWRGSARLRGGIPCTIVLRADDALLFQGETAAEFTARRLLKGFSQKKMAAQFDFAPAG